MSEKEPKVTQHFNAPVTGIAGNVEGNQNINVSNSETFNNDLRRATIANFANQVKDNARQVASNFSQQITQNANEISRLVYTLRDIAEGFPEAQRDEALIHLDDLQEDLSNPQKTTPQRIKTRIIALWMIACTIAAGVAGAADFSNNVLELSEKGSNAKKWDESKRAYARINGSFLREEN